MNLPAYATDAADDAPVVRASVKASPRFDRLCFASGIISSALFLLGAVLFIAVIVPRMPAIDAPVVERTAFYVEMARNGIYRSISYLGELQMGLLLLFFAGLHGVLRRIEGETSPLSLAVFGAGVALAVVAPLTIMVEDHLMLGFAAAGVDPKVVASMDGLGPLAFALGGFPQALVTSGAAALFLRESLVPRWMSWFGVIVGVLSLAGTGTLVQGMMFPVSSLAMLLFRVWVLMVSVALARRAV